MLTHLGCWVHARHPFIKAEEAIPKAARSPDQLASRCVWLIGKLYSAESAAKDWTPNRRLRLRSRYSARIVRQIEQLLLAHLHAVAPSSLSGDNIALPARAMAQAHPLPGKLQLRTVSLLRGAVQTCATGADRGRLRGPITLEYCSGIQIRQMAEIGLAPTRKGIVCCALADTGRKTKRRLSRLA